MASDLLPGPEEDCLLFFLLLGPYLVMIHRPLFAGLITGLGFMTRLVPILLVPGGKWSSTPG